MPTCAPRAVVAVLLVIVLLLAAIYLARSDYRAVVGGSFWTGGQLGKRTPPTRSPHIVIDTLNLTHWLRRDKTGPLDAEAIIAAIDETAPMLKKKHPGRVMYVLKGQESIIDSEPVRRLYMDCAERNRVYIIIAEKYADPPRGNPLSAAHSARGRDDFLLAVLAQRWKCAALTEDRFRDFNEFRSTLQPFHVYELAYWQTRATREFIRPESAAYARLRKPRAERFEDYL